MKKLITSAIIALSLGIAAASAVPAKQQYKPKKKRAVKIGKTSDQLYNGHYNRRGVYTYTTTEIVWKRGWKYKNTYLHKIFPNGRHKVKLIKSKRIHHVYPIKVRYRSKIVYLGQHPYRITYRITRFSNGQVQRLVYKRERVGRYRHASW
ncbi:MAG: hypothetical protein OEM82_07620 [Acidobacteriota bacterium]|nr:hypothetical protein [Acidobacteriota bacterium]MDH3530826.1 hypothetical protein [Acidobacteriota bacterium]